MDGKHQELHHVWNCNVVTASDLGNRLLVGTTSEYCTFYSAVTGIVITLAGLAAVPLFLGVGLWILSRKYSHLPGDLGSPVFGNLAKAIRSGINIHPGDAYQRTLEMMEKHGDTIANWYGLGINIVTSDPTVIEMISNHPAVLQKEPYIYGLMKLYFLGTFTTCHSSMEWKMYRQEMLRSFTTEKLKSYLDSIVRRGRELADSFVGAQGEFDVLHNVLRNSLDVILDTHYGINLEILKTKDIQFSKELLRVPPTIIDLITNPISFILPSWILPLGMPSSVAGFHKKCLDEVIRNVLKYEKSKDGCRHFYAENVVKRILATRKRYETADRELREIIYEGGFTISTLIASALLFIAMNPKVQKKTQKELDETFPDPETTPTYDEFKRLEYLDRVVSETIRLVGPPVVFRRISEEVQLGGLRFPKGSTVTVASNRAMTDARYWACANGFNPDHFLPEAVRQRHKFLNPFFGIAPRKCVGSRFACLHTKVVLAILLRRYEFSSTLTSAELKFVPRFMMDLDGPYCVSIKPRFPRS